MYKELEISNLVFSLFFVMTYRMFSRLQYIVLFQKKLYPYLPPLPSPLPSPAQMLFFGLNPHPHPL